MTSSPVPGNELLVLSNCCHGDDVFSEMCGGRVDAIWDINALVAIPMDKWNEYVH